MKMLVILYDSALTFQQAEALFKSRARSYTHVEGLKQKHYVRDPATGRIGGVYLFDSEASLRKFRASGAEQNIADTYRVKGTLDVHELDVVMSLRDESPPEPSKPISG